jgi:hypothetical protein
LEDIMITRITPSAHHIARLALVALLGLAALSNARAAEGSSAERSACTGDALRLCSSVISNSDAVKACMISHQSQLSPACQATFPKTTAKAHDIKRASTRSHATSTSRTRKRVRSAG